MKSLKMSSIEWNQKQKLLNKQEENLSSNFHYAKRFI